MYSTVRVDRWIYPGFLDQLDPVTPRGEFYGLEAKSRQRSGYGATERHHKHFVAACGGDVKG